jgi:negative regulator of flagellin synthesis FlgM
MKIGSLETKPPVPVAADRTNAKKDQVHTAPPDRVGSPLPATPAKPEESAQVQLSSAAKLLGGIKDDAGFDAKKVERIASAIRAGTFKVNPDAIADKLIANAAELLARKPN